MGRRRSRRCSQGLAEGAYKGFDEPSHALFVAKPQEFNHVLEEFLASLPK